MADMWPGVTKKLLKWKKPKNILFHSKLFLSTFWWKGKFLDITSPELLFLRSIWYRCCNLRLCFQTFSRCWIWQISNTLDLQHVHMFIFNPMIHVANTNWGFNLNMWTCWWYKVFEICQILLLLFCLNKDQFWFLLMLRTSSAEVRRKKTLQGNTNCSAPNTVTGVSKVTNERYLPYLQLCRKALMKILMYFGCKSGRKLR